MASYGSSSNSYFCLAAAPSLRGTSVPKCPKRHSTPVAMIDYHEVCLVSLAPEDSVASELRGVALHSTSGTRPPSSPNSDLSSSVLGTVRAVVSRVDPYPKLRLSFLPLAGYPRLDEPDPLDLLERCHCESTCFPAGPSSVPSSASFLAGSWRRRPRKLAMEIRICVDWITG
ncbi:hypothetical protein B0H11DRAFT_2288809 [Mycena galericulata]|nr:hypothetical protein B0H11DRAFT_2288809 [Mycena galericulata]